MVVVLITGCSSGFGLELAVAFARRGDRVVATLRDPGAEALRDRLDRERLAGNVSLRQLDVTQPASIERAVADTLRAEGQIDVLVNNAGIGAVGALEIVPEALLREVFETNVFGAVAVTRAVLPHMRQRRRGRIVFMGAIGGLLNTPYLGAYCASKHALDCLAATWDIELRPFGIRVSSVLPSAFHTPMAGNLRVAFGEGSEYEAPAREYHTGLTGRIVGGPRDLSPVVDAVIEAATSDNPRPRYLVAPHLADVLGPLVDSLERLHEREVALAPQTERR
jgi:NAD(P)-dependent dehydrogenase (short-subunit alcohol dehydrogenase family)